MCPLLWAAYRGGACAILPLSRLPLPPPPTACLRGANSRGRPRAAAAEPVGVM